MLKDFQPEETYRCKVERLHKVGRKYQLDWLHYLEQCQLANFALTFAVVISLGIAIGFILQT